MIRDSEVISNLLMGTENVKPDPIQLQTGQPVTQPITQTHSSFNNTNAGASSFFGNEQWLIQDGALVGNFHFSSVQKASAFVSEILNQISEVKYSRFFISLQDSKTEFAPGWVVKLTLEFVDTLSDVEKLIAHYASYLYIKVINSDSSYTTFASSNGLQSPKSNQSVIKLSQETEETIRWVQKLSTQPLGLDSSKRLLKVPFCLIGSWNHPNYGVISFTQKDFDDIQRNFKSGEVGFEPPLFLGHPIETNTTEGQAAEAFLREIVQEGNVLVGIFEAVSDETYAAVALGRYRYSSGEFIRNWMSKSTGESVGTALIGVALTNRPFLPNLPRVNTLSVSSEETQYLTFQLEEQAMSTKISPETPVSAQTPTSSEIPIKPSEEVPKSIELSQSPIHTQELTMTELEKFKNLVTEQFAELKTFYNQQLEAQKQELALVSARSEKEKQELLTQLAQAQEKLKENEVSVKLKRLEALALPVDIKEKYKALIRSGALGEQESLVLETLEQLAQVREQEFTTQHGTFTVTQAMNNAEVEDPYASVIERNRNLVKAREEALLSLLK